MQINEYPTASLLTGAEVLLLVQNGQAVNANLAALVGLPSKQASTGKFYSDTGATVNRLNDRLLVGAAADNQAATNRNATPNDWLSTVMGATSIGAYAVWGATAASLARYGQIGLLGGSRTSDAEASAALLGYKPSSIGVASWAIDDDLTTPRTTNAYAYYGEVWRLAGVGYQPSFAMELEVVNFGVNNQGSTPFHINCGGGSYGIQLGSGGGQASGSVQPGESGITFVNNPSTWNAGITFGATALSGTDGTQGFGSAVQMATFQALEWRTAETVGNLQGSQSGGYVRSVVTQSAKAPRLELQDAQFFFGNAGGQTVFVVEAAATVTNYLAIQSGAGTQAAGLYATEGPNGSPNLGLYPASGGEIQTSAPVVAAGSSLANNPVPAGGWMHINVNNQDVRIPLFSPAQAGG